MTNLYLKEIQLDEETKCFLESIPSSKEAGEIEIEKKTNLFFTKVKEMLEKEYPFLNSKLFDIAILDNRKVCITFNSSCGWDHNKEELIKQLFHLNFDNNKDFRKWCEEQFQNKFGENLIKQINNYKKVQEELKLKIHNLQNQLNSYELVDFDYTTIQYKNLNDLNSAKFLSNDEKKAVLGIPIKKSTNN